MTISCPRVSCYVRSIRVLIGRVRLSFIQENRWGSIEVSAEDFSKQYEQSYLREPAEPERFAVLLQIRAFHTMTTFVYPFRPVD